MQFNVMYKIPVFVFVVVLWGFLSTGLVEIFIDAFKRAIKKSNGIEAENEEIPEFLSIYQIRPNPNTDAAERMFARKIRPVFNKLISSKKKKKEIRKKLIPLIRLIVQGKIIS